jgi:hypothetical protein
MMVCVGSMTGGLGDKIDLKRSLADLWMRRRLARIDLNPHKHGKIWIYVLYVRFQFTDLCYLF